MKHHQAFTEVIEKAKEHLVLDPTSGHTCSDSKELALAFLAAAEWIQQLELAAAECQKDRIAALEACLTEKDEALKFYANKNNWKWSCGDEVSDHYDVIAGSDADNGEWGGRRFYGGSTARKAIAINPDNYQQRMEKVWHVVEAAKEFMKDTYNYNLKSAQVAAFDHLEDALSDLEKEMKR